MTKQYSTWLHSRWFTYPEYVFHKYPKLKPINQQIFKVETIGQYTFEQIDKNINSCVNSIVRKENKRVNAHNHKTKVSKEEKMELKSYMRAFVEEMINLYNRKGFVYEFCSVK